MNLIEEKPNETSNDDNKENTVDLHNADRRGEENDSENVQFRYNKLTASHRHHRHDKGVSVVKDDDVEVEDENDQNIIDELNLKLEFSRPLSSNYLTRQQNANQNDKKNKGAFRVKSGNMSMDRLKIAKEEAERAIKVSCVL